MSGSAGVVPVRKLLLFVFVALAALAGDLWTKVVMQGMLEHGDVVTIVPNWLYLRFAWNPGVAFGMLQNGKDMLLYVIPLLLVGILVYAWHYRREPMSHIACLAGIFGGALGNYYDRLAFGMVRDFIDVKFGGLYDYPIFNLADAYISCGVVLLMVFSLWEGKKQGAGRSGPDVKERLV